MANATCADPRCEKALWHCGTMALWHCGTVKIFGTVALWHCGTAALWHCATVPQCHSATVPQCLLTSRVGARGVSRINIFCFARELNRRRSVSSSLLSLCFAPCARTQMANRQKVGRLGVLGALWQSKIIKKCQKDTVFSSKIASFRRKSKFAHF